MATTSDYHIVKTELFDADVMEALSRDTSFSKSDKAKLSAYKRGRKHGNQVEVVYYFAKGCEENRLGRLYVRNNSGLQAYPFDIRNPLLEKHYWDIDMENCHYHLLQYLGEQWGIAVDGIKHYCANRDKCLGEVSSNRSHAKTEFLKVAYGGNVKLYNEHYDNFDGNDITKTAVITRIEREMKAITNYIWSEYQQYQPLVKKKDNPKASLLALVLQTEERKCILALDEYFKSRGRSMDIIIHDGGEVRKLPDEIDFPEELLRGGEEAILTATGFKMKLVNKPFKHGFVFPEKAKLVGSIPYNVYKQLKEEFEKDHFYLRSTNTVCEVNATGIEQFPVKHAAVAFAGKYQYSYTNDKQELKQHDLISAWLIDPDRRQYERLVFRPDGNCEPQEFNSFNGYAAASFKKGDPEKIEEANKLLTEIILNLANGKQESAEYIHNWICDLFQNPAKRAGVALILSGEQGVGKDTLGSLIGRLVGRKYYGHFEDAENQLFGAFNSQLEDKMFIHLEELQGFATRKNSGKLKAFITKSDMLVNHKGIIPYQKDIYHRYFATTNEVMPVKVEEGDRRYAIFFAGSKNKGVHAYWERVATLFQDEGVLAGLYERLMTADISRWNPRNIVETQEKLNLQQNEISYEQHFLEHLAADEMVDKYDTNLLYNEYVVWCQTQKLVPNSKNHFGRLLTPFITKGWITTGRSSTQRFVIINSDVIKATQQPPA
jgi:hypothetical protein